MKISYYKYIKILISYYFKTLLTNTESDSTEIKCLVQSYLRGSWSDHGHMLVPLLCKGCMLPSSVLSLQYFVTHGKTNVLFRCNSSSKELGRKVGRKASDFRKKCWYKLLDAPVYPSIWQSAFGTFWLRKHSRVHRHFIVASWFILFMSHWAAVIMTRAAKLNLLLLSLLVQHRSVNKI